MDGVTKRYLRATWWCVLDILTSNELYVGKNLVTATRVLEAGTTFGAGRDREDAREDAETQAAWFRHNCVDYSGIKAQ